MGRTQKTAYAVGDGMEDEGFSSKAPKWAKKDYMEDIEYGLEQVHRSNSSLIHGIKGQAKIKKVEVAPTKTGAVPGLPKHVPGLPKSVPGLPTMNAKTVSASKK